MSNDLKAIFNKQKREEIIAKMEKYTQAHQQEGFTEKEAAFLDIQRFATDDRDKALDKFLQDYDNKTFAKLKNFFENHKDCIFIRNDGQGYFTKARIIKLDDTTQTLVYEDVEFQTVRETNLFDFINEFNVSRCK